MRIQEKLNLLQQISGLTQQELASRLGVTFVAFNRWINGKAVPRAKAQAKIDALFADYSGQKIIPATVLAAKKGVISSMQKKHKNIIGIINTNPDIRDQFLLSLTYNSNRIEGSTLSENETAAILFENAALTNRTLVEQLEAKNHQAALMYLFDYLKAKKTINEELITKLHSILMNAIRSDAGIYRNHGVRIMGSNVPTANHLKIGSLMKELAGDINTKNKDLIAHATSIHSRFEQIHPFADGNGRIGRLLMHAMLLGNNLPPAVIKQEQKRFYNSYLSKAQLQGDMSLLEDFVCDAVLDGFKIIERAE